MPKKSLKFLIDVGVGRKVEVWLSQNNHDVKTIRNLDPAMDDNEVIRIAASESRIVITMDKDFGELVYRSGAAHTGVLLLRLGDATGDEKARILKEILAHYADQLADSFCVDQRGRLRIRSM